MKQNEWSYQDIYIESVKFSIEHLIAIWRQGFILDKCTSYPLTSDWFVNNGTESCLGGGTYKSSGNANYKYHLYCSIFVADHKLFKQKFHVRKPQAHFLCFTNNGIKWANVL